jgi:mono/diheme cytochrome c family protein
VRHRYTLIGLLLLASCPLSLSGCGGGVSVPKNASPGLKVFDNATCGSCHTLAAASSHGTAGPKLTGRKLDAATVEHWVRTGGNGMPDFGDQLSAEQIRQVAQFVAQASK